MIPKTRKKTKKLKHILLILSFLLLPSVSIPKDAPAPGPGPKKITMVANTSPIKTSTKQDSLKDKLINEIDNYIDKIAPESRLRGKTIVKGCLKHNIEPAFVLAQSQIECHFGTTGTAKKSNSAWNVGAYDGKSISWMARRGHTYRHPDDSLEPYLSLLEDKYLADGKTIHHLMRNYVSTEGRRYASSRDYESNLRRTYEDIKNNTKINTLYNKIKKEA